jgi:class 3 adenylate cyclase/tetratricopeptide (TPR) repeat protein
MAACPSCGNDLPGDFPFCPYCGGELGARAKPAEERKVVSVLFCDLVGFTAASETADPEDVRAQLMPYPALLKDTILSFGGTVEKFAGDAIMAVFGAPIAHEDDAERAVRAGLRILDALDGDATARQHERLHVRIGINTGEVVVTLTARPEAGESFVTGDVVNTAARIQTAAPVDAVVVGEATYSSTMRVFAYEALDAVAVKGKTGLVRLWRAGQPRARLGVDVIRSLTTPLVGRTRDVTLLLGAFEKASAEKSAQLVTVVGEPGVGKSRLVAELGAHIDASTELVTWRQGRCLPYGEGPFWAVAEIVKAHAGILETDSTTEASKKLDDVLPDSEERQWLRARLLPLLGIDTAATSSREESFTAWRRLIESLAESGPAVVVFDDIHWADDMLLAFIEHLADWASGLPLLIVCTARPELLERHVNWTGGMPNALSLRLSRLSDSETAQLISTLLDRAVLPAATQTAILQRVGGNPLYAEEFVRMVRDSDLMDEKGALRSDVDIPLPDGVQSLIAARLDTLSAERKEMLADAAVVGNVFWGGAVATMGERPYADVAQMLHELSRKELVRPVRQSSMAGQSEYTFWHVLVRDVAYAQIPRAARSERHAAAASWIESQVGDRVEDAADILAYHLGTAFDLATATSQTSSVASLRARARKYALVAARKAMNLHADQALTLLDRALTLTADDDPERPAVLLEWARAAQQTGRLGEAAEVARAAVSGFEDQEDVVGTARALMRLSLLTTDIEHAEQDNRKAVALLESIAPTADLVDALTELAVVYAISGRFSAAIEVTDRVRQVATQLDLPVPLRAQSNRSFCRVFLGDLTAIPLAEEAVSALRTQGEGRLAAVDWANLGLMHWQVHGPRVGLSTYREALAFATPRGLAEAGRWIQSAMLQPILETGDLSEVEAVARTLLTSHELPVTWEVLSALAWSLAEQGREEAVSVASRALEVSRATRLPDSMAVAAVPVAITRAAAGDGAGVRDVLLEIQAISEMALSPEYAPRLPALARAAIAVGDVDLGASLARDVRPLLPIGEHALVTVTAQLAQARGDHAGAVAAFSDAVARWHGFGNQLEEAYAQLGLGRSLLRLADVRAATASLRTSSALFVGMGARAPLATCQRLLAEAAGSDPGSRVTA